MRGCLERDISAEQQADAQKSKNPHCDPCGDFLAVKRQSLFIDPVKGCRCEADTIQGMIGINWIINSKLADCSNLADKSRTA